MGKRCIFLGSDDSVLIEDLASKISMQDDMYLLKLEGNKLVSKDFNVLVHVLKSPIIDFISNLEVGSYDFYLSDKALHEVVINPNQDDYVIDCGDGVSDYDEMGYLEDSLHFQNVSEILLPYYSGEVIILESVSGLSKQEVLEKYGIKG